MSLGKIIDQEILEDSKIPYPIVSEWFEFMSHLVFVPSGGMFPKDSKYWTIS